MFIRHNILILDPSPIFRRTLKSVIETSESHVDVREAGNSDQATSLIRKHPPDVVFIDIALPRNNGIAYIAAIKEMAPEARVVVMTSHDSQEHKAASLENGADYFLSKDRGDGLRLIDVIHATVRRQGEAP